GPGRAAGNDAEPGAAADLLLIDRRWRDRRADRPDRAQRSALRGGRDVAPGRSAHDHAAGLLAVRKDERVTAAGAIHDRDAGAKASDLGSQPDDVSPQRPFRQLPGMPRIDQPAPIADI